MCSSPRRPAFLKTINMNRKYLTIAVMLLAIVLTACAPAKEFGPLTVCSSIDSQTYQPLDKKDEFEIETGQVYAAIEVANVPSDSIWTFKWINQQDGQILSTSSGQYMEDSNLRVSGYFASVFSAAEESQAIALPGTYRVEYYHDQKLIDSKIFTVMQPEIKVERLILGSQIGVDGLPMENRGKFYNNEDMYLYLKLNYLADGTVMEVTWLRQQEVIAETGQISRENNLAPAGSLFELKADSGLVPGGYRVDIALDGLRVQSLEFEVVNNLESLQDYFNDHYDFSFSYPQWMMPKEKEGENFYLINLYPRDQIQDMVMGVWIIPGRIAPPEENLGQFADNLATGNIEEEYKIELASEQDSNLGYAYVYKDNEGQKWELRLDFKPSGQHIFMVTGLARENYVQDMEAIFKGMMDSLKFPIE